MVREGGPWVIVGIAVAVALLYPIVSFLRPGWEIMLTYGTVLAIAALGFNLLFHHVGLLSFGHAAFFGIGAYTVGLSAKYFGLKSLELHLLIAALLSALFAFLVGSVAVRYRGIFFAILMLVVGQITWGFYVKFYSITGGTDGVRAPKPLLLLIYDTAPLSYHAFNLVYHYYSLLWFVILALAMWYIVNSPFGYTLRAIRDSEDRARSLGVESWRYKLIALAISATYVGIAGALYAPLNRLVTPDLAYWTFSGKIVFMTILGGAGHFLGPILGALVYTYLETIAQMITIHWFLVMGLMIVLIMVLMPEGILGLTRRRAFRSLTKLPFGLR
ncbi:MAG: branched-chain amino acid ABC transporter permease [Acidilobaceae archaeon]|nr:branched-chain amino acid ABC transporter permease [Acidilobaceae archaeon]MCX8165271.1 branched-chain amino acid ABC transporter permease [Acidilobaceae archaeon]MDW7973697.1 branched-chain amino acid ABC transporter permease [Sulfolobales archaeon]